MEKICKDSLCEDEEIQGAGYDHGLDSYIRDGGLFMCGLSCEPAAEVAARKTGDVKKVSGVQTKLRMWP